MTIETCVIVGASHAGVNLALQLRREGWSGGIQLISAESELPYHRPPLSKELLAGAKTLDSIRLRPEQTYADNEIDLILGAEVVDIKRQDHAVHLKDGRLFHYARLALCTGAEVRKLPLADTHDKVYYIRSAADTGRLAANLDAGKRAVIIGAGYIGLEVAAQLSRLGLQVTVLEAANRILNRVTAPVISGYFSALHASHGVAIRTGVVITDIQGDNGVNRVICQGGQDYEADVIVIGVGINPNIGLAERAGLAIGQGILVNEYTQTSDPKIFAAGDCTQHPSALYHRQLRLESVQNATDQARIAAANMCGKQIAYDAVPWFWSDQYDVKLQTAGIGSGYDAVILRGDVEAESAAGFAAFYLQAGKVLAVDCINRPREFMIGKQLVRHRASVAAALLEDETSDLQSVVAALQ